MATIEAQTAPASLDSAPRAAMRVLELVTTISCLLVEARFGPTSAGAFARRAQRTARTILAVHGIETTSVGSTPRGPAVVVANHVSYLDPLVVSSLVPCISIAKGEAQRWPLIGPGLSALGVVFVRRGDAHSGATALRRAWRALRGGATVLNFPEGTTSDGRGVGPFLRGAFGLARLARVSVVPARIVYDDDRVPWFGGQTFAPHYARLARVPRVVARVHFGQSIEIRESDDLGDVAQRARAIVSSLRAC